MIQSVLVVDSVMKEKRYSCLSIKKTCVTSRVVSQPLSRPEITATGDTML
jgi:hypothetical protein